MFSGRHLLQVVQDGADGVDPPHENTTDVRIIAIFVIFIAGLLGGLLPLFIKCFRNSAHPATLILRALAAGVMLALAVIHVIPDGMADLGALDDYPFASCCIMFGVVIMIVLENTSRAFLAGMHSHSTREAPEPHQDCDRSPTVATARSAYAPSLALEPSKPSTTKTDHLPEPSKPSEPGSHHDQDVGNLDRHSHTCLAVNNAANWASNPQGLTGHSLTLRNQIMAYMFELACVIHSFLIGIALGVTVDSRSQAVALLVALVFHQGLEGVGLGSTVVKACFPMFKATIMIITYALMTPLGVAIGMAISGSYSAESTTALAVQGTLNSISGGLLLYISLVQLIAEDFSRADSQQPNSILVNVAMHIALVFGAACMAIIAIWN